MPSNKIQINNSDELTFEVPDSFMEPLMSYLQMVKEKTTLHVFEKDGELKIEGGTEADREEFVKRLDLDNDPNFIKNEKVDEGVNLSQETISRIIQELRDEIKELKNMVHKEPTGHDEYEDEIGNREDL